MEDPSGNFISLAGETINYADVYRQERDVASAKASEVARQLAFAGFGLAWVLSGERLDAWRLDLVVGCGMFVVALLCDLSHYFIAATKSQDFAERLEDGESTEAVLIEGGADAAFVFRLFKLKVWLTAAGYGALLSAAVSRMEG